MVIRAELFQPGLQIISPDFFNQMTTVHGLIMVFGAIMPAFTGLGKLDDSNDDWRARYGFATDEQLELLDSTVCLYDFAYRRSLWKVVHQTLVGRFMHRCRRLIVTAVPTFFVFAVHIMGISSIMGAINIIVTIMNMRAPGMTYMKMPLFVWTLVHHRLSY